MPGPAPQPGTGPEPTTTPVKFPGPPKRPEWAALAPGAAPASRRPGFDPLAEKRWNIVTGGALPYNGSEPVRRPPADLKLP